MGEITLKLQVDRQTGKKNVVISYRSDEGALPLEHEQEHRALVDKLIQGGTLKAADLGKIVVERQATASEGTQEPTQESQQERESLKES